MPRRVNSLWRKSYLRSLQGGKNFRSVRYTTYGRLGAHRRRFQLEPFHDPHQLARLVEQRLGGGVAAAPMGNFDPF